jgi:hypothetical protein
MTDRNRRLSILEQVAKGELSVEESSDLLKNLESDEEIKEAASEVDTQSPAAVTTKPEDDGTDSSQWKKWWIIPFGIFIFLTILSGTLMATSYINNGLKAGFWISLVFFFICIFGLVVSFLAKFAKWIHIRVTQKPGERPQHINLSFPLPLKFARWTMNNFSWAMPEKMRDKQIGDAIQGFEESISQDQPFHVFVDEEDGEHVEIYIG